MTSTSTKNIWYRYALTPAILGQFLVAGVLQGQVQVRDVFGDVRSKDGRPIAKATVQLENVDTQAVQTFISDADGTFHFKRTSKNTDYEIWSSFDGHESKKTFISKFNDKESVAVKLVIDLSS